MNATGSPPSTPVRTLRVLVIDDNDDAAQSLEQLLLLDGHEVRTAATGRAGLAAAEAFLPQLVLLDIGLPDLDGFEVARLIRATPWGRALRLVALTGWGQAQHQAAATEAGFDLHVTKPIEPRQLDAIVLDLAASLP